MGILVSALLTVSVLCCARELVGEGDVEVSATPLAYYSFGAPLPPEGFCETQVFGKRPLIIEPVNFFFSLFPVVIGLIGMLYARRSPVIFHVLYALLIAWGAFAALYHAGLSNGMYRIMDVAVSFLQAFVGWMLIRSLYVFYLRTSASGTPSRTAYALYILFAVAFTSYPAVVHVAGESSANPWVAWLVFDLLWLVIAGLLIAIWMRRRAWPGVDADRRGFRLIWMSLVFCILAYGAWSVDKFVCSAKTPMLAYFSFHGWWHIFMALCFFSMIGLCQFLTAAESGCRPLLLRFPASGPLCVYVVTLKSPDDR